MGAELSYFAAQLSAEELPLIESFSCGDEDLDAFLSDDAWRLQQERVATTYLAFPSDGSRLLGYATVLVDGVSLQTRERRRIGLESQDHPVVPALKIARLGVHQEAQGKGVGNFLVSTAFSVARALARSAGCRLLVVDAYSDALPFYEKLGFQPNRSPQYRDRENPSLRLDVFGEHDPDWL